MKFDDWIFSAFEGFSFLTFEESHLELSKYLAFSIPAIDNSFYWTFIGVILTYEEGIG